MEIKPGIYENVPFEEYLKWDCFSKSMVKGMLRSGMHLKYYTDNPIDSEYIRLGSLVDSMLLAPEELKSFTTPPLTYTDSKGNEKPWTNRSNTCREWANEKKEQSITVVTQEQMDKADAIVEAVRAHRTAGEYIANGKHQVSIVWEDEATGELCKGRIDNLRDEAIDDLKTTQNASPEAFRRDMGKYLYHVQAAAYSDGWSKASGEPSLPFNFIAVENEPPHGVAVYSLGIDSLMTGRVLWRKALDEYHECKVKDKWPGYSEYLEELDIPAYALINDLPEDIING